MGGKVGKLKRSPADRCRQTAEEGITEVANDTPNEDASDEPPSLGGTEDAP